MTINKEKASQLVDAYERAMACQHDHYSKLIVMANYGDLALDLLKDALKKEQLKKELASK